MKRILMTLAVATAAFGLSAAGDYPIRPALKASNGLKLIPYCLWDNREPGNELQFWFREK